MIYDQRRDVIWISWCARRTLLKERFGADPRKWLFNYLPREGWERAVGTCNKSNPARGKLVFTMGRPESWN
jgi:hypothetical protein